MSDTTSQIQDAVLSAIKQAQDLTISSVESFSEAVAGFMPDLPELPFAEQIPSPKEFVEQLYGFAGQLFEANRDYALRLAEAMAPVYNKAESKASA
jgi:hypothetical protein